MNHSSKTAFLSRIPDRIRALKQEIINYVNLRKRHFFPLQRNGQTAPAGMEISG